MILEMGFVVVFSTTEYKETHLRRHSDFLSSSLFLSHSLYSPRYHNGHQPLFYLFGSLGLFSPVFFFVPTLTAFLSIGASYSTTCKGMNRQRGKERTNNHFTLWSRKRLSENVMLVEQPTIIKFLIACMRAPRQPNGNRSSFFMKL